LRVAVGLAVLSATLAFASAAGAQTALDAAKGYTRQATVEYNVGHFEQALELYGKAYEALPTPVLLFDIGQCHRMLGRAERAIFFFEGYLRDQPGAPNRPLVEQLLRDLHKQLDEQRAAAQAEEQQRAAASSPAPVAPIAPGAQATVPADTVAARAPRRYPELRIPGLATAGAGVVLIGTAVGLGLHASSLSNEISRLSSQNGTWSAHYQSDYEAGKTSATAATVLSVAGGVALAAGGALTYLGYVGWVWPWQAIAPRPAASAAVAPVPGGASFVVVGGF
jgi:tetratricopeptide (TPR) repeat protein